MSVLLTVSKLSERIMQNQNYFSYYYHPHFFVYTGKVTVPNMLYVSLIEKCRVSIDKGGYTSAILIGFSKDFHTLNHEFLVAKLHADGCIHSALKLRDYLTNR